MIVLVVLVLALVVGWLVHRSRRARRLSGTVSDRPVFQVDPPRRRVGIRRTERL